MTPPFSVTATPHYDRLARRLTKQHREFDEVEDRAREILQHDPDNRSRRDAIRKLEGVSQGEGQFRLTLGRWRFRYDISSPEVMPHYCGLWREDTYR
jgi:hypothetical protein